MEDLKLTGQDKMNIAEFIFSKQTDILIKSDVIKVIETLFKHKIIDEPQKNILTSRVNQNQVDDYVVAEVKKLLTDNIPKEQVEEIMSDYYSGKF